MQMMINMLEAGKPDRADARQLELYDLARRVSPPREVGGRPGASPHGWASALNKLGYGKYRSMTLPTMEKALRRAARQMRLTGKPVGLIVWGGGHSWVMSGYKATADPARTDDFDVIAVWVEDPWHRWRDATWGRGLAPHTRLEPDELSRWFVDATFGREPRPGARERYIIIAPLK